MPPRPPADDPPDPAPDPAFGALVRRLSEPESGPHADNFLTNEDSFPRVCDALARRAPEGGVYLGVGPDQNFTYIAQTQPALSLVLDFRRRNLLVHLLHKALFSLSPSRAAYLGRLTARAPRAEVGPEATAADLVAAFRPAPFEKARLARAIDEVAGFLHPFGVVRDDEWPELATIQARIAVPGLDARFLALPTFPTHAALMTTTDRDGRPAHMLATAALYDRVRRAQRADLVVPVVADLAGTIAMPRVAAYLRDADLSVATVYVSDVEFFLLRDGADPARFASYLDNLERLPRRAGAVIVRSTTRPLDSPERVPGDRGTTAVRDLAHFLRDARAGRVRTPDSLFDPEP